MTKYFPIGLGIATCLQLLFILLHGSKDIMQLVYFAPFSSLSKLIKNIDTEEMERLVDTYWNIFILHFMLTLGENDNDNSLRKGEMRAEDIGNTCLRDLKTSMYTVGSGLESNR